MAGVKLITIAPRNLEKTRDQTAGIGKYRISLSPATVEWIMFCMYENR